MSWLGGNWHRVALVLIAGAMAGFVIRYLDVRQATLKQTAALAEKKHQLQVEEARQKQAQGKLAYVARRRGECYAIYEKERQKWNNVEGPEYDAEDDVCRIRYEKAKPRKAGDCDELKDGDSKLLRRMYIDCITNTFTSEF